MKSKLLTKVAFPLLILFFFLISLFVSMILMRAVSPQGEKILLETDNEWGAEKTNIEKNGVITLTRNVFYQSKLFPIGRMRWTEDVKDIPYNGYVKLVYFIYNRAENTTTATYSGKLYPK